MNATRKNELGQNYIYAKMRPKSKSLRLVYKLDVKKLWLFRIAYTANSISSCFGRLGPRISINLKTFVVSMVMIIDWMESILWVRVVQD